MSDRIEDLREEMLTWSRRPPQRSSRAARSAVLAGIRSERPSSGWKLFATACAAVVLFLLSLVQPAPRGLVHEYGAGTGTGAAAAGPLASSVIVYQLRSGATLYVVLPTPVETAGAEPASRKDGQG